MEKSAKPRVLVDPTGRKMREIFSDEDLARLHAVCEVVWARDEPAPQELFEREKADLFAVACCGWRFGPVADMPRLRAILEVGGGPPPPAKLDYPTCFARGIHVLNCAPSFGQGVAEMALGMAIDAAREISLGDRQFRAGEEKYLHKGDELTFSLFDARVGFIGYGSLARNLQALLQPFRCRISAYDPWRTDAQLAQAGVSPAGLDDIMAGSDVIFALAIPTSANQAMITRRHLEMIRRDRVFVLMSRAHVVDFDALTDLLLQGRFKAAIDVFPKEPLPGDHPIRGAEAAVLSAHRAGAVREQLLLIGRMVVDDLEAMVRGLPPWRMQRAEPELIGRL